MRREVKFRALCGPSLTAGVGDQSTGAGGDDDETGTCGICKSEAMRPGVVTLCGHVYCRDWCVALMCVPACARRFRSDLGVPSARGSRWAACCSGWTDDGPARCATSASTAPTSSSSSPRRLDKWPATSWCTTASSAQRVHQRTTACQNRPARPRSSRLGEFTLPWTPYANSPSCGARAVHAG